MRAFRAKAQSSGVIITVLAFAGVVIAVTQTVMVPLLSDLPDLLQTTRADAAWAITITLLTAAVGTPVLGRLGDMFGKRRLLLVAVGLLIAGSLVCGWSSSLLPMMIGRGLQGFAIGTIPLGISIMRDELPADRLAGAVGLMSSSLGIGGALALPLAAVIAEYLDWHWLFFGSAVLGVLAFVPVLLIVPESPLRTPGRFDVPGTIGLTVGLVCLLLGISKGGEWGFGSARTLGFFGTALVVLLLWGWFELRTRDPLVDLRTSARRQVLLTNLASILVGFALFASQLVPPQLVQLSRETGYGLGQSMVVAGFCAAPSGALMMAMSPVGARITTRRGPKVALLSGLVVLAVGYAAGIFLLGAAWQIAVFAVISGAGVGLAYAAMPALIIDAVPDTETAAANGLNALMRAIGTSSSSAVAGMVLSHMTTSLGSLSVPSLAGFRTSYLVGGAACVLGALIAVFIPARVPRASRVTVPEPVTTAPGKS